MQKIDDDFYFAMKFNGIWFTIEAQMGSRAACETMIELCRNMIAMKEIIEVHKDGARAQKAQRQKT